MRILIVFIDMLRANRHFKHNSSFENSQFVKFLQNLGGVSYINCFTQAPDTPRSLATFYSGLSPQENGCNLRHKWPGKYLKVKDDLFNFLLREGYYINCFSNPKERAIGLFPSTDSPNISHNEEMDLKLFLQKITLKEKQLTYVALPDFHWAMDDFGATLKGEKFGNSRVLACMNIFQKFGNLDEYDHVFFYSDHGFKFHSEFHNEPEFDFINADRTNVMFHYCNLQDKQVTTNGALTTLTDFLPSFKKLILTKTGFELPTRSHITVEDYYSIAAGETNLYPALWAFISDDIYIAFNEQKAHKVLKNKNLQSNIDFHISLARDTLVTETHFGRGFLDERQGEKSIELKVKLPKTYSDKTSRRSALFKMTWKMAGKLGYVT